jgi:hypothetical protein
MITKTIHTNTPEIVGHHFPSHGIGFRIELRFGVIFGIGAASRAHATALQSVCAGQGVESTEGHAL